MIGTEEARRGSTSRKPVLIVAVVALLLLAIFLPPLVNLGHYRRSIIASMSAALGRPVFVGSMQLRLLPTPGISMTDFSVEEDPGFGYEPALHANSVVASLRLSSLWRGRLEVSRISLDEASLNLVRNNAGQWSIGSLLLRASQIPNAPTGQRHVSAHPRFPYIEASDARINFKQGAEKKPFSLMNAEFSMWQANTGEWRLRLEAQPVRTDLQLHLSDTGEIRVEGSLRRAADLSAMPVDFQAEWSGAQLGQVSRLLAGFDSGWRGDLDLTAAIRGSIGDLQMRSHVRVANLRRFEFQPAEAVNVDTTCQSEYRHAQHTLSNITCFWPIATGHLLLSGSIQGFTAPSADLHLELNTIPNAFPLRVLGLMRAHAQNVTATGTINGSFGLQTGVERSFSGQATTSAASLSWPGGALALPPLHFIGLAPSAKARRGTAPPLHETLQLAPFPVDMGGPGPLMLDARFTRSGFQLHAAGPASIDRLKTDGAGLDFLANALNAVASRGRADLNVTANGSWVPPLSGGSGIASTGSMKLHNVQLLPAFLRAPVEVSSADVTLTPDQVSWQNAALRFQGLAMAGSVQYPTICNQTAPCPASFTLNARSLSAGGLEAALASRKQGILGQLLSDTFGRADVSPWPPLHGSIQCGTLELGALPLQHVTASVEVEGRHLTLESVDAAAIGGNVHATGSMTMDDGTPQWKIDVRLTGAKPAAAGAIFGETWGGGVVNGDAQLTLSGYSASELASSAAGDFRFTWQNGGLPEAGTISTPALNHFERWTASGTLADGVLTLDDGGLSHANRVEAVRGTISLDRQLHLTLETRRGPVRIGGTLANPGSGDTATQ